jgi:hypothetical protein
MEPGRVDDASRQNPGTLLHAGPPRISLARVGDARELYPGYRLQVLLEAFGRAPSVNDEPGSRPLPACLAANSDAMDAGVQSTTWIRLMHSAKLQNINAG